MTPGGTSLASTGNMVLLPEQKEKYTTWRVIEALRENVSERQSTHMAKMTPPAEVSPSGCGGEARGGGAMTMGAPPQQVSVEKSTRVQEAAVWGAEDGYISEGGESDYSSYIPQRKKMARRDSAMEGNASAVEQASLLSQPPPHEASLQDVPEGDNAAELFAFKPFMPQNIVWDGGDVFFSDNSETGTQCSSESVSGMEEQLNRLDLENEMDISEDEEAPSPSAKEEARAHVVIYDDTPIMNEWDGGEGYFSGSDYGDYREE